MCDSRDLFYRLRDNYVENCESWLAEFRADPLIQLVMNMMSLKPTVQECIYRWYLMSDNVCFLMELDFMDYYGIPWCCFEIQDNLDKTAIKVADASILDK